MTQNIARKVAASFSKSMVNEYRNLLTSREQEIKLIGDGKIEKEVATILNISASTVKNHITNIYTKLHLNTKVEALT
jgi:DNA-binding NarL/FixJ family response regulator